MARTKADVLAAKQSPQATPIAKSDSGISKSTPSGRPRGRPRSANPKVKVPSGRPRGRPKGSTKAAIAAKKLAAGEINEEEAIAASTPKTPASGGKGTRGRPRKSDATSQTPSKTPSKTPKSTGKRGRPSKKDLEARRQAEAAAAQDQDDDALDVVDGDEGDEDGEGEDAVDTISADDAESPVGETDDEDNLE